MTKNIDVIYFDSGGGHRATANALKSVLMKQRPSWRVNLINVRDLAKSASPLPRFLGTRGEDIYNWELKHGFTLVHAFQFAVTRRLTQFFEPLVTKLMSHYWESSVPDLVISVIPFYNGGIFKGLRGRAPMVTLLTDLVDCPPHFWMEKQKQYFICATDIARQQAVTMGNAPERIIQTSGIVVRPEFYNRPKPIRSKLPTGIVMFGGYGSSQMIGIAKNLCGLPVRMIFICGHNDKLRERIERMELPYPSTCVGFTDDIPSYMAQADFFIGKPGCISISESLVVGLPVIVERNAWTMVQERFNTDWIEKNKFGIVLRSFREIGKEVNTMLNSDKFLRTNVATYRNNAVFEIPEIFDKIVAAR